LRKLRRDTSNYVKRTRSNSDIEADVALAAFGATLLDASRSADFGSRSRERHAARQATNDHQRYRWVTSQEHRRWRYYVRAGRHPRVVPRRRRPQAGANGSGKTTFARQVLPLHHPAVPFLNADEIRREDPQFHSDVAAARELLRRLESAESTGHSFAVETTLSSMSYVPKIRSWKTSGYRVVLHCIGVPSADFAVQRVAQRVAMGGHDMPERDIRRRFDRGLTLFDAVYKAEVPEWYQWLSDSNGLALVATHGTHRP
jgi:predicted ABC-type ATPase